MAEINNELLEQQNKLDEHQFRLDQTINDSKFWLDKYTDHYKKNEKQVASLKAETNGRMDTLFFQLSRKISIDDMRKNFKALNDMLYIKFK